MNQQLPQRQVLTCTLLALSSGFFGGYLGGQITSVIHREKCQNQPEIMKYACSVWVTPGAMWQGSTTGLWMGTILGAFAGGLLIRKGKD
jgi:hypothetical protein